MSLDNVINLANSPPPPPPTDFPLLPTIMSPVYPASSSLVSVGGQLLPGSPFSTMLASIPSVPDNISSMLDDMSFTMASIDELLRE